MGFRSEPIIRVSWNIATGACQALDKTGHIALPYNGFIRMANVQKQSQYQAGAGVGKMRGAHGIIVFG